MRLTTRHDAFGREIWSSFHGGSPLEIVERDDGYIDAATTAGGYVAPFRRWPDRQRRAMAHVRGRRALDVGCGAGRVALYLQDKGFQVTAIDSSPLAIRVCSVRGVRDARVLAFEEIARLPAHRFDTVVMLGNNFGLFGSAARARRLLKQLHRITSDGAVILAETINPYRTTNPSHRRYQRRNRQRGRMPGQIRIRIRFEESSTPWFDYLFVSPSEMRAILKGTGWRLARVIDGGRPSYVAIIERI